MAIFKVLNSAKSRRIFMEKESAFPSLQGFLLQHFKGWLQTPAMHNLSVTKSIQ